MAKRLEATEVVTAMVEHARAHGSPYSYVFWRVDDVRHEPIVKEQLTKGVKLLEFRGFADGTFTVKGVGADGKYLDGTFPPAPGVPETPRQSLEEVPPPTRKPRWWRGYLGKDD